jgi:hypothetical protein
MEFMLIFSGLREAKIDPSVMQEMGRFAGELAAQGKLKGGAPLFPEDEGARVQVRDGKALVTDGPFTETKEVIGGFFIVDAADLKEAVAIAKRAPHAKVGFAEVRRVIPIGARG